MTSTTSYKSKFKQGLSFFLWSLYTGKTTMIIYLALLTFLSFVGFIFGFGISMTFENAKHKAEIWEGVALFICFASQFIAFVFTFVFSVKEFSYLHDKRKTDMFGSLPSSRRTIFFSKLAAIVAQSALPWLLIMVFLAIMNKGSVTNYLSYNVLYETGISYEQMNLWYTMLRGFIGLIVNAVFLGFLSICCGKTVDKVLTFIIINAAYPIGALLIQTMPASFLLGYSVEINEWVTCAFSPYLSMYTLNPIYWAVFAIVFGALSFFMLPKRKAECAQSHFAFKAPLIITKVLVSFAAGMVVAYMFGLIFSSLQIDKIAFFIGMVLGSFTAYFVIQIIFAKGFKGFGKGMIPYGALMVCFIIAFVVFNTGMAGYESYVPSADEVASVNIIGDRQVFVDGKNVLNGDITNPEAIAECVEGHKEVIQYCKNGSPSIAGMTFGGGDIYDDLEYIVDEYSDDFEFVNVTFTYKLKNGMTVKRDYGELYTDKVEYIRSDTFKNYTSLLFLTDPQYISEIDVYGEDYDEEISIGGEDYYIDADYFNDITHRVEFAQTLKSDILAYGNSKGKDVCEIDIMFGDDTNEYHFGEYEYITVRSTYKNTIALLVEIAQRTKSGTSL